jgi:hypothetical protein
MSTPSTISVPFRGWTFARAFTISMLVLAGLILVVHSLEFGIRADGWTLGAFLLAGACGIGILAQQANIARRIELSQHGIRVFALWQERFVPWTNFAGFPYPPSFGVETLVLKAPQKGWVGAYNLTLEQARAILAYPACPQLDLAPNVRDGLQP